MEKKRNEMNRKKKMRADNNYCAIKLKNGGNDTKNRDRMSAGDEQGY